ncbi:flagellar M-ring protein FliF [Aquibium carbonis]|uniref:Flagellar M-ring protein n=1 Tax=Aquibium carbonis TaxID=2495581 RepID=A0A3S0A046_9HYPH|nr:flagellar basal-body MS-ring/collar protein FliF [Aquibium carbonis]RST85846.1 flagellar M-ring protein FliF [Aquibium carbonis]
MPEQIQKIADNLLSLGPRKLAIMGGILATVVLTILIGAIYLNRPATETLYIGLDRNDVSKIGVVLSESGISYDVGSDGTSVMVATGFTGRARMILADKGLPSSSNAGYELFDKVGSLGLTSFMQEVTRVRALEGEIARTIQSIAGIKTARVHIVMSQQASFRREEQQPTASVVIRSGGVDEIRTANSIRHLVAAAVPGLTSDNVTVLDTNGALLATGDDPSNSSINRSMSIERTVESQVADNIYRALAPFLGRDNFRASVKAVVNTDARQIEETIFDPDSRVERSIRTIRENNTSNETGAATPVGVDQNIPDQGGAAGQNPTSAEERERREEITNYEVNSKRIATTSNGYQISRLSIAVVVNRDQIAAALGAGATADQLQARVAEIENVVATAVGLDGDRGDKVSVTALSFVEEAAAEGLESPGILEAASQYTGSMINALAFVIVAFLVSWFGLRPLAAALTKSESVAGSDFGDLQLPFDSPLNNMALPDPLAGMGGNDGGGFPGLAGMGGMGGMGMGMGMPSESDVMEELKMRLRPAPQERLAHMVELNEERTAAILRKWVGGEAMAG